MRDELREFFSENIHSIRFEGGSGSGVELSKFQLTPRDFLSFAELDLEGDIDDRKLVNATSNLKRAVDCTLDNLMLVLNLDDLYRKKRLGVDKKLGFFKKAGVFHARSLTKLNLMRNRLEHHYELPVLSDVDVYFDLVVAFVSISDAFVGTILGLSEIAMVLKVKDRSEVYFESVLNVESPSIYIDIPVNGEMKHIEVNLCDSQSVTIEKIDDFAFLLRVHTLLVNIQSGAITPERFLEDIAKDI